MNLENQLLLPCAEKIVFETKKQAEATATVAEWQHGAKLTAYQCRHCNLWHLSSRTPDTY